jgi:hypothetical protein
MVESISDQLSTLLAHPEVSEGLSEALERQAGAQFYRCALQVNPFGYRCSCSENQ